MLRTPINDFKSRQTVQADPYSVCSLPTCFQYFKTTWSFAVSRLIPVKQPVKITVFWDMTPWGMVSGFKHFSGMPSTPGHFWPEDRCSMFFWNNGTKLPVSQCHITEDHNPNHFSFRQWWWHLAHVLRSHQTCRGMKTLSCSNTKATHKKI